MSEITSIHLFDPEEPLSYILYGISLRRTQELSWIQLLTSSSLGLFRI